jgi:hypothetical protein
MSPLTSISKPVDKFKLFTIYGGAGVGKTSLAATFPKPIVMRFEDGLQSVPSATRPDAFPIIESFNDATSQLMALINEQHDYRTLVIDSVTKAERMFIEEIVKGSSKTGTNQFDNKALAKAGGGYGAGYQILSNYHQRIRNACQLLVDKKDMNIVFIGHSDIEIVDLPDTQAFQRFTLKMNKQGMAHYVDDVDFVGFLRLEAFVMTDDNKKAKARSSGDRIIQCASAASSISKNRMGIHDDIAVQYGINPLSQFLNNNGV